MVVVVKANDSGAGLQVDSDVPGRESRNDTQIRGTDVRQEASSASGDGKAFGPQGSKRENVMKTTGWGAKIGDGVKGGEDEKEEKRRGEEGEKGKGIEEERKTSKFKGLSAKLGLDVGTVLMMFKGSVAPTIGIAIYQADSVARLFNTLGYLIPILTVLSMPIMPRAKYLQTLILNTFGVCIGAAIALLGIWSGVKARENTTPAGSTASYNSSQSVVCAIWLFVNIWFANVLRAKMPALQFPVIMYSIFTNVSFTYGPLFPTSAAGEDFVVELLRAFLVAFAISTGVNLFVIPMSSRLVVFKEQAGYIQLVRGVLKAQSAYLQSLETSDMFAAPQSRSHSGDDHSNENKRKKGGKKDGSHPAQNLQAKALKDSLAALIALHGRLYGDMTFAKREAAWGKLDAKDLEEIFALFRDILIPLNGMSTITDIFERIAERRGWVSVPNSKFNELEAWENNRGEEEEEEKRTWNEIMKTLHEPFEVVTTAMDEGLHHAGLALELIPKPKAKQGEDAEAKGEEVKPGDPRFAEHMHKKMADFYGRRGETLRAWARQKGLDEEQLDAAQSPGPDDESSVLDDKHSRDQQQLYLILYLENLLHSAGVAILKLVQFADSKVADGTMKKNRLINPGQQRLKKWILSIGREDSSLDSNTPDSMEAGTNTVYMGAGFNPKGDPEHLPAKTAWQKFGNGLRTISHFMGSTESAFGFRVACATLTVGIIAFLKDSQEFFIKQRLVWAMIIIAIGMTMTSGQSIFGFFARVAGTALAMVFSIVIWYIVNEQTAGVIVFLWLFIFVEMYFFLKYPRFIPIWLMCIVTQVLIIGYELQVEKIGIAASVATGQPYYPTYQLAPYRLACVAGGCFIAFVWTVFPYPLSDRSWLRKDLGSTLYLLANYYSVVHSTIVARMHNSEGDMTSKHSPGKQLEKFRYKIFSKLLLLIPSLQEHADWQKWEPTIGGKFPRKTYESIIQRTLNLMNYISLMSYTTKSWTSDHGYLYPDADPSKSREWLHDLSVLLDSIGPTSHAITSVLSLLSASVTQGSALPPYIQLPESYNLSRRLEKLDRGILGIKHVEEPGYSAYAVLQVCSSLVVDDLRRLVEDVKELVGETDFSFQISSLETGLGSSSAGGSTDEAGKGKVD
ncbi:uncharacterized protein L3040_002518 [Drepanopeziza brunnea f. sp. 'multigermtubi']|uniref:uncharacterized protein n=1 Tax=Drepanopeziza brunnea f. sp. 'multigermtubi' TaxID=698441 RepID=UPI0023A2C31F|nr:hypothetical protein L3040_002518 [Drepanopeziza brunnea f. sp. 'multigermtubi']